MAYIKKVMEKFQKQNEVNKRFNNYIEAEREKSKYDPRPDFKKDHYLWVTVLKIAEQTHNQVYWNLHGFRIAGCKLKAESE